MSKRRDFIKKSTLGLVGGMAFGKMSYGEVSPASSITEDAGLQKNWQADPEWRRIKYGDWGGPGVSAKPGPMDKLLLKDHAPQSLVVTQETFVQKAKYPAIDSHVHVVARTPKDIDEWIRTMDEVGIETSVVLTAATGKDFANWVKLLKKAHPKRFQLYCGMDLTDIENKDFPMRLVKQLEECHEMGAVGVGEISDKGTGITRDADLPPEKRLHPDDARLDEFWEKCAELNMPVNLHVADHPSCWTPLDVYQERTPDYQHFNLFDKNVPAFSELIDKRNRTLAKHPDTIFVACHMGNQGHDLTSLSQAMDKYPNLYLDTSARDYELGRTPRSSAKFLNKYRDRIIFGTDMGRQKSMYQIHWRLLETDDEYIPGRVGWRYYGLDLPGETLKAIYRDTAKRIFKI